MHNTPRSNHDGTHPTPTAPLAGLQVVELSSFVAAPLGGMTLAQLGADVIRVDPIGGSADAHRWPIAPDGASLYWAGLNKGKRSVTVDLRSSRGRDLVEQLVSSLPPRSGVVITNSSGQDWLGYEALRRSLPDLIHVHVLGRNDGQAAVDYTVNAETGFPFVTGPPGQSGPINHVLPAWDIACGLYVSTGVAAAARRRELTGEGSGSTVALADVALAMAGNLGMLAEAEVNHVDRPRIGNHLYGSFARDFVAADGRRFMIVALTRRHWRDLLAVTDTGRPVAALEASLQVDFSDETSRYEYREVLAGLFARWFAHRSGDAIDAALSATSLLWSPYRTFTELVHRLSTADRVNPIVHTVEQPGIGSYLSPGSPLISDNDPVKACPAPVLGADTEEVLSECLQLSQIDLQALRDDGVIPAS